MQPRTLHRRIICALISVALACVLGWCVMHRTTTLPAAKSGPLAGVFVILDPGHGGADSGAIRGGVREDVINYRMASAIAVLLRERGATVIFTVRSATLLTNIKEGHPEPPLARPKDARLASNGRPVRLRRDSSPDDLYDRAAIAEKVWSDLPPEARLSGRGVYFLSLHCDKLPSSRGRGARVYFDKRGKTPSRFAVVLKTRLTLAGLTNSSDGMVIPRHYGVLNPAYNPVPERALLEMATLSNSGDCFAVLRPAWRWRLARLIRDSIVDCDAEAANTQIAMRHPIGND